MNNYSIVVARYNEDVEWVKKYENHIIYNKGSDIPEPHIRLENVGREAHTYLHHIVKNYDNLSDYVVFLQGNPFDHSPNLFNTLDNIILSETFDNDFCWISERVLDGDFTYQREPYIIRECPYIDLSYEFIFGDEEKPELFSFGVGAQFLVSKERIRSRSLNFYQKLFDFVDNEEHICHEKYLKLLELYVIDVGQEVSHFNTGVISRENPQIAYYLERFWGNIFNYQ